MHPYLVCALVVPAANECAERVFAAAADSVVMVVGANGAVAAGFVHRGRSRVATAFHVAAQPAPLIVVARSLVRGTFGVTL